MNVNVKANVKMKQCQLGSAVPSARACKTKHSSTQTCPFFFIFFFVFLELYPPNDQWSTQAESLANIKFHYFFIINFLYFTVANFIFSYFLYFFCEINYFRLMYREGKNKLALIKCMWQFEEQAQRAANAM